MPGRCGSQRPGKNDCNKTCDTPPRTRDKSNLKQPLTKMYSMSKSSNLNLVSNYKSNWINMDYHCKKGLHART